MNITNKAVADLIPYAANAKKHDEKQIKNVAESIKQFGFVQPVVGIAMVSSLSGIVAFWRQRNLG